MSITIERILGERGASVFAQVRHGEHVVLALVNGDKVNLQSRVGQQELVEMSFDRVARWSAIAGFQDEESCIMQSTAVPEAVMIRGRVHNAFPIDSESSVIDLYLLTGPEFVAIDSKELNGLVPEVGSALEIHVHGLCFYPTTT